jgi:hypothetical protein
MAWAVSRFEFCTFMVDTQRIYCQVFRCLTMDGAWFGEWIYSQLTYNTRNYTLQTTDTHRLVCSLYYTPTSRFLATVSTEGDFSVSRTQVFLSEPPVQNSLSTDNSTNRVPGWLPFHTNLLVFSSQTDFQLPTNNWIPSPTTYTSRSVNWAADYWLQLNLILIWG